MFDGKPKNPGSFKPGDPRIRPHWQPGQSGNPAGRSKRRIEFEQCLADALATEHPEEAAGQLADICWQAARKGEAWSVQLLFARLAPVENVLKLKHQREESNDEFDWSKLTDEEFQTVSRILERIEGEPRLLEEGSGPPKPE
jgi:hypothetical protein